MIGTTVGHYRIDGQLGRGGMGEVFLARDTKLQRRVALKVLPPAMAADEQRLRRFQREAQAVAALNHPNVVTIYSVEQSDGMHFLTMELVDGRSLSSLIPPGGMEARDLLEVAVPLAEGVAAAHQRRIIHRDLKPGNVMVTADRRVKVLDFGLAKLRPALDGPSAQSVVSTDELTSENRIVGTPAYMSPEQAEGREVDPRTDIFSIGVMLYEMATGRRPFQGDTAVSIISSILRDTPPPILQLRPELPWELDRIVKRCLAKEPERRYQSAYDLRNDLDDLLQQIVRGQTPPAALTTGSAVSPSRRRWFWVLVIVAAAGTGAWLLLNERRSVPQSAMVFTQMTAFPGVEWFPSLSPDGKWVVYSGEQSGNREIYLQGVGGQNAINLTQDPAADDQPAFSPDGESIAFRSSREGGGLFVMGRTGESVRRLARQGFSPAWSPDGRQIVYSTQPMELTPQNSAGTGQLWIVNVDGGGPRALSGGDAIQPSWSPSGHRIAYAVRLGVARQMDIWTIPAAGGTAVPVTSDQATDWNPIWAPDGQHLYFASDRGGSMNLWRIPIAEESGRPEGPPQPVTTPATFLAHLSISRDGRKIAYSSIIQSQNVQKLTLDPRTGEAVGEPVDVTRGTRLWSSPDPTRDGTAVAFYSRVQPEGDLYVAGTDGSGFRQVTSDEAIDRVPRWSPDRRWITTFSNRSGSLQLWNVRPDGSELTQITDAQGDVGMAAWSPDGTRIAVATVAPRQQTTLIFDPFRPWKGQTPEILPRLEGEQGFVVNDWSADGSRLIGQAGFAPGVVMYSFASRSYRRLAPDGEWPVWLPDSRRILYVAGGKDFFILNTDTEEVRRVFSVPRDVIGPPRLTADGRSAYFTRRSTEGDIWIATME